MQKKFFAIISSENLNVLRNINLFLKAFFESDILQIDSVAGSENYMYMYESGSLEPP